jgi:hypothetical protein
MGLLDWLFGKQKTSTLRSALPETIAVPASETKPTSSEKVVATPSRNLKSNVSPKLVALAEKYMNMDYPSDPMDAMLASIGGGPSLKKPKYSVAGGKIQRASESMAGMGSPIDMKIVQVASCLKSRGNVNMFDAQAIARFAMDAVQHYAALPKVRKLFLAPYEAKVGELGGGADVPLTEQCRILAGVEILLLEIYAALPYDGSTITDALVEEKIDQLVSSA